MTNRIQLALANANYHAGVASGIGIATERIAHLVPRDVLPLLLELQTKALQEATEARTEMRRAERGIAGGRR